MTSSHSSSSSERPTIVVLGSGFGAFSFLKKIDTKAYQVNVVSPRNHFLFTPLLTNTTVGSVEFRSIIEPIRSAKRDAEFCLGRCTRIDVDAKKIFCESPLGDNDFSLDYDKLVIAVGGENSTFGIPGVREHSLFLKEIADARAIRQKVLACFERAEAPGVSKETRKDLLHFIVVGGGPTGIEFAAELHDFLDDAEKWYPDTVEDVRITVLEAMDEILPSFDKELQTYAMKRFEREGIEVRIESPVNEVKEGCAVLKSGEEVNCGLLIWSTGIAPRPLISESQLEKTEKGFLLTDDTHHVKGQDDIYAVGDTAMREHQKFPATAQVAQREGKHLAKNLNRLAKGEAEEPFEFKSQGMLAYVGDKRALADLPAYSGTGIKAWIFWRSVYLTKLVRIRNKILVLFDWIKTSLFGRDTSRF